MLRRWRAAWPRRSKRFDPPWPQGPQTQPFPGVHKPAGARPTRFPARPRRGRFIEPAWPQGSQATPPPSIYDQAGARPRFAPRLRRGHFHEPPWPQGSTATPPPAIYHGAGPRPIRFPPLPRRGRSFEPPWPQGPQSAPLPQFARARIRALPATRRGRVFTAPPATATGTVPTFACTRRPTVRTVRRGSFQFVAPLPVISPWLPQYLTARRRTLPPPIRRGTCTTVPGPGLVPTGVIAVTVGRPVGHWHTGNNLDDWRIGQSADRWHTGGPQ